MPELTPANKKKKRLRRQIVLDHRDAFTAELTAFVLEESGDLEPGLAVDESFYQRLERKRPALWNVLPEDMRLQWFSTDLNKIANSSGGSRRAQMLLAKWKQIKKQRAEEQKEKRLFNTPANATPRPKLPSSLDGDHSPTKSKSNEAFLKKSEEEGHEGKEGTATQVLKELMNKLDELGAAGYKTSVEGRSNTTVAVYQVRTYSELMDRLKELKAKVDATPPLRATFAAFDESADISDLMKLEHDLFQHMERQHAAFEAYAAGLEALKEGLKPLTIWAGQLSKSIQNPYGSSGQGRAGQQDGAGGESAQGKLEGTGDGMADVRENQAKPDKAKREREGEEEEEKEDRDCEDASKGPKRKIARLATPRQNESRHDKNMLIQVSEMRLRAVTHVTYMVQRFLHTELTAATRAYQEIQALDVEVHNKVVELITGTNPQVAAPPKETPVAFLDLL